METLPSLEAGGGIEPTHFSGRTVDFCVRTCDYLSRYLSLNRRLRHANVR